VQSITIPFFSLLRVKKCPARLAKFLANSVARLFVASLVASRREVLTPKA